MTMNPHSHSQSSRNTVNFISSRSMLSYSACLTALHGRRYVTPILMRYPSSQATRLWRQSGIRESELMPSDQLQVYATDGGCTASPVSHFEKFLDSEHSVPGIENIAEKKRVSICLLWMEGYRKNPKVEGGGARVQPEQARSLAQPSRIATHYKSYTSAY